MRHFHFIVNPAAGRGMGAQVVPLLQERMERSGRSYDLSVSTGPGEVTKLAAEAGKDADVVVAVGGDGTVHEVVNGLPGSRAALGVLPAGTGNDFIKMVAIPPDPEEALRILLHGETRKIDLGVVNDRFYVNSVGIGLDAAVARTMNRTRWLKGKFAYYYSIMVNIFFYRNRTIRWSADGASGETRSVLAAVMNGTTYGGNFNVAPGAICDDGLFDLIIGGDYGVIGRLLVLPKFKKGRHLGLARVSCLRARRIRILCDEPLPIQVDGEQLPDAGAGTDVSIEVLPGELTVVSGSAGGA